MKIERILLVVMIVALLAASSLFVFTACTSKDTSGTIDIPLGENYEIIAQETFELDNSYKLIIYTIVDTDTGVMYNYVRGGIYGGGLTPIYNADGTLKRYVEWEW